MKQSTAFLYGNRCGHNRCHPHFLTLPKQKTRPVLLRQSEERLKEFFFEPRKYLRRFYWQRRHEKRSLLRSESREALCRLLIVMLNLCNLASLEIGVPTIHHQIQPVKLETLAKKAELGKRRAERAFKLLKQLGYIKVHKQPIETNDGWVSLSSVKSFTMDFFLDLGFARDSIKQSIKRAKQRWEKQQHSGLFIEKYSTREQRSHQRYQQFKLKKLFGKSILKAKKPVSRDEIDKRAIIQLQKKKAWHAVLYHLKDNTELTTEQRRHLADQAVANFNSI